MTRKPTNTHVLQARISPNLLNQLKTLAEDQERTVSDLVRDILRNAVLDGQRRTA